ncbi:hypothetical protein [Clostridium sp. Cult3]|uniref:hypothetical protein n=1 Tax=Clostridium sp. Cult3 TaxID=2079004 RepID=UPI001F491964|nr:hypothetical protein [Clostridium sp. Cult3]MCF6460783.1 hypothetical protein [Clostridium sp. Cult3]
MKDINWLKDDYLNFLQQKKNKSKTTVKELQEEERIDEANLEKIRLNVIEIFSKIFDICNSDNPVDLKEKYIGYFNKITKPWYLNKKKATEFHDEKEAIIEEIKIQEAESLKSKFEYYYQMEKIQE